MVFDRRLSMRIIVSLADRLTRQFPPRKRKENLERETEHLHEAPLPLLFNTFETNKKPLELLSGCEYLIASFKCRIVARSGELLQQKIVRGQRINKPTRANTDKNQYIIASDQRSLLFEHLGKAI